MDFHKLASSKLLDYIAAGNLPVIVLGMLVIFLFAWIKYEHSIRSLFGFLRGKNAKEEARKEKKAVEIRTQLFFDKMASVIQTTESLKISADEGRDFFHHWVLRTLLETLYSEFSKNYKEYQDGEVSPELFCSFHKHQYAKVTELKHMVDNKIKTKLESEGWTQTQICYVLVTFNTWFSAHKAMLSELLKSSKFPEGVVMAWWVLFYEILISIEKFGFLLNGRLKGEKFEGLVLGDCHE